MPRIRYLVLGGLYLMLGIGPAGCRQQGSPEEVRGSEVVEALLPVVLPGLDGLEQAARSQLQIHHASLRALASRREVDEAALGAAYGTMGQLLLAYDYDAAAEPALRNAERLLPDAVRWPYYLGVLYQRTAQLDAAARAYERALALDPSSIPLHVHLAEVYRDLGREADTKALADAALRLDPRCAAAFYLLGQIAETPSEAIAHYEKVLALQPSASRVHYPLGLAYRNQGDMERSRYHLARRGDAGVRVPDALRQELERLRQGAGVKIAEAVRLMQQGRLQEAAVLFEGAVADDPASIAGYVNLGAVYERLNQLDEAAEALTQALRLDPAHAEAHYNLGLVSARRGDEAAALDHLQAAVAAAPTYTEAHLALSQLFWQRRQCREALPHFEPFLAATPEHVEARLIQTMCHVQVGQYAEARTTLDAGLALVPDDVRLQNAMVRVLAASADDSVRDGPRAVAMAEHLVAILPRAAIFEILAMAYAEVGRYDDATEQQQAAIRAAEQEGLGTRLAHLNDNLRRYEQGQPCRTPWAASAFE